MLIYVMGLNSKAQTNQTNKSVTSIPERLETQLEVQAIQHHLLIQIAMRKVDPLPEQQQLLVHVVVLAARLQLGQEVLVGNAGHLVQQVLVLQDPVRGRLLRVVRALGQPPTLERVKRNAVALLLLLLPLPLTLPVDKV